MPQREVVTIGSARKPLYLLSLAAGFAYTQALMAHQKIQVRGYTANLFSCPFSAPALSAALRPMAQQHNAPNQKAGLDVREVGFIGTNVFVTIRLAASDIIRTPHPRLANRVQGTTALICWAQALQLTKCTGSDPDRRAHPASGLPHRSCSPLSARRAFLARQTICRPEFFP